MPLQLPLNGFRRTLVGLKPGRFEREHDLARRFRRTLVGLKLAANAKVGDDVAGFRRTLVGLKPVRAHRGARRRPFQTNPRGVEATSASPPSRTVLFQTNPRGVEAPQRSSQRWRQDRFRRTLVGLKHVVAVIVDGANRFRRTLVGLKLARVRVSDALDDRFQTNPRGVEASHSRVSAPAPTRFRRTLVGLKLDPLCGLMPGQRVSDEPSWG